MEITGADHTNSGEVVGARGEGEALHARDPDGYLIGLKPYDPRPQRSGDEAG